MKAGVITFPGSNCDRDMRVAIKRVTGTEPTAIWHNSNTLEESYDLIAIPGGFSYGDYLRCGAVASKSRIMEEVIKAANNGTFILGVCNGFQILTEAGLLPGALMRNTNLHFICKDVELNINNRASAFTKQYNSTQTATIPIAHHDGNYRITDDELKSLQDNDQIAFTYANDNPNGSVANIAGILNKNKNVLGMMPHPERATDPLNGSTDGNILFTSLLEQIGK